jgi:hypothetical protein
MSSCGVTPARIDVITVTARKPATNGDDVQAALP